MTGKNAKQAKSCNGRKQYLSVMKGVSERKQHERNKLMPCLKVVFMFLFDILCGGGSFCSASTKNLVLS